MRNGPLCWGMLVTGEAVHVWGQEVCGKFLLPLSFAVNLKLFFCFFFFLNGDSGGQRSLVCYGPWV